MPPLKKLNLEDFQRCLNDAGDRFPADKKTALLEQFQDIRDFAPPVSYEAWLTATNVAGRIYGTKSRGDRLMAVDRAYKAWIAHPDGIMHGGNAENLRTALETYTGVIYRMTGRVSGLSRDYRNERNRGDVMTKTLALTGLITRISLDSPTAHREKREADRRAMLALIANINVEWSPVGTIIGGVAGAASNTDSLLPAGLARDIVRIVEGSAVGVGAVGGGIAVATGHIKVDETVRKVDAVLQEQKRIFFDWMFRTINKFTEDPAVVADVMAKVAKAFALVCSFVWKSVANTASGAADMYDGLKNLLTDAWTRHTITLQQLELGTSDGAFALIRNGIDIGIRNRQAVAAWTIAKGATKTALAVAASPAAVKIADLVMGAFEFIFKLVYNLIEADSIKKFIDEARTMWKNVKNGAGTAQTASPPAVPDAGDGKSKKAATGTMPAFKAASYSPQDFITDGKAAYLNFLYSLVKASPVLAAVVMNSGAFKSVDDVLHAATPRSTDDVERARQHIVSLKIEAARLFRDSGFEVVANQATPLDDADNSVFQQRLKGARLLAAV